MESCRIVLKGTLIVRNNCWQKQVFPISNHVQQRSKVTAHEWGNNFPLNSSSILNCEFCYWTVKTIRAAWGGGWFVCHSYSGLTVGAERHAWLVFTAAADLTRKESVTSSFAPFRGLVKLLHKSTPVGCIDSLFFCLTLCLEGGIVFFLKKKEREKETQSIKSLGGRCVEGRPAQLSIWRMCWHGHGAPLRWNFNSFKWKPEQLQKQSLELQASS